MELAEIRKQIKEILKRYNITHSECNEKRVNGEVKFVDLHIQYKVDKSNKNEIQKN